MEKNNLPMKLIQCELSELGKIELIEVRGILQIFYAFPGTLIFPGKSSILLMMWKVFFLFIVFFVVMSCQKIDYFAEYRGVNLAGGYPLTHTGWTANITTPYFNFEQPGTTGDTTGLPVTTGIYRMEIYNLFPNGDFISNITGWTAVDNGALPDQVLSWIDIPDTKAVNNGTFYYELKSSEDRILYDLAFLEKGHYRLDFDFKKKDTDTVSFAIFENGTETVTWEKIIQDAASDAVLNFQDRIDDPTFSLSLDIPAAQFSINSTRDLTQNIQNESALDNIQITRIDIAPRVSINLPLADAGRLPFVPGSYRFSLYVKNEDSSQLTPTTPNRFPGNGIKISLFGIRDTVDTAGIHTYAVTSSCEAVFMEPDYDFSSWCQATVEGIVQVDESEQQSNIVMRLAIAPAYFNSGSLLIACPGLEFIPE